MDKVEKAVIELGGKWPEKEEDQGVLLLCKKDHYCDGEGGCYRGKYYAGTKLYDRDLFEGVCTYPEFMEARKRLENKPTEWPDNMNFRVQELSGWWHFFEHEPHLGSDQTGAYIETGRRVLHAGKGHVFGDWRQSLVPRPSSHPMNNEHQDHKEGEGVNDDWLTNTIDGLPPSGTQCMASWLVPPDGGDMKPIDVRVVAYDVLKDKVWLATSYGDELVRTRDACFYPRKSHRDKVIEVAREFFTDLGFCPNDQQLGKAFDSGLLKLPEGEE